MEKLEAGIFILIFSMLFLAPRFLMAEDMPDLSRFNGKKIGNINVSTTRIKPEIVKNKFPIKEGDVFDYRKYDDACKKIHDMGIFKKADIDIALNENDALNINISGEDGYFIFPLPMVMSSGENTMVSLMIMESNLFKYGELVNIMGIYGNDGYMGSAGFFLNNNNYGIFAAKQDYTQKQYAGGAYSSAGLFGSDDYDKDNITDEFDIRKTNFSLNYGHSFLKKYSFRVSYNYNYVDYAPNNQTVTIPKDAGYHNQINVSFNVSHNAGGGASMAGVFGSIFGFGNSGKDLEIKNLSYVKLGYSASLDYSNGGSYTGADFAVSKLSVKLLGSLELKTRHRLYAVVKGGQMFEGGFSDSVSSAGLLTGKGKYHAVYLGEKGAGAGFYASLSLMKNKTAVLVFEPFVETSWTYDENTEYRQSGTGASLYVTFWRFRLPIGVNYTHNINDKDYLVSFVAGAGF